MEGDIERRGSTGWIMEAQLLTDYQWGAGVLAIDKIELLAENTMVGL
jgi:hypothetical protein